MDLDGEHIGAVLGCDLEGLDDLLRVGVLLVHAGPQALLGEPRVSEGVPDGSAMPYSSWYFFMQLLLACDDRLGELFRVVDHLEDPLVLQLNRWETEGYCPVHDVLGDVVDVLPPQGVGVLLSAGPWGEVDLWNDDPAPTFCPRP